jgi:DNA-directed RNA polymerase specialized sigma24 family protein
MVLQGQQERRIDEIETIWSEVRKSPDDLSIRNQLLMRYHGAVYRYLFGALKSHDLASDLTQQFAVRFLGGAFSQADRQRGRFRDYVKAAVGNLIIDHRRRKRPEGLLDDVPELTASQGVAEDDSKFLESWRDELLDRAWAGLASHQERTGQPFYTVLRFRADHPELRSSEMAERLSVVLDKPVGAGWTRQTLLRARRRFADLLLDDLAHTLESPTRDHLEQELINLGLHEYCSEALERWRPLPG